MIRYGFACKTIGVPQANMTGLTLAKAGEADMLRVCAHNLQALLEMLRYCRETGIRLMRISSDVIPLASHPQNSFDWRARLQAELALVRNELRQSGVRVSMHPGQYTVMNSPRPEVVEHAVRDLRFHADFLDAVGAGAAAPVILHLGGGYNDRQAALNRLVENLKRLPSNVLAHLSLENDERIFTIEDVLDVCGQCGLPAIFDVFHHSLNPPAHGGMEYWLGRAEETWGAERGRPKLHYSQQLAGGKPGMHSRFIATKDFLAFHHRLGARDLDVMLEVKDKNLSALKCLNLTTAGVSRQALTSEWARYKYLVLERDQALYTAIRTLLKSDAPDPADFYALVEQAMEKDITPHRARNAAEHVWGYVDSLASPPERRRALTAIKALDTDDKALPRLKRQLLALAQKHNVTYLLQSLYFYI